MTRQEVEQSFTIRTDGRIADLGKFESEQLYVPAFWDAALSGGYTQDVNNVFFFQLDDTDRATWPELSDVAAIALEENDQGFVTCTTFGTMADYLDAVERMEREESEANSDYE
jgi:hypothetical protein